MYVWGAEIRRRTETSCDRRGASVTTKVTAESLSKYFLGGDEGGICKKLIGI